MILLVFCTILLRNHKRIWNLESYMHIANRCAPWKIANGAENPVLQALQFQQMGFCRKFPGGTDKLITDLMRVSWKICLIAHF
jgi:hypothetical protein